MTRSYTDLFALTWRNTKNDVVVFVEKNSRDASEHFLEMFLQSRDVFAVVDDF